MAIETLEPAKENQGNETSIRRIRQISLLVLTLLTATYVFAVPLGLVDKDHRLETAEIILVALLVIASSSLLERLVDFSFGSEGISARFDEMEGSQREMEFQLDKQATNLDKQQSEIRSLQVALRGIVTKYEYDKLVGLSRPDEQPFMCYYSDDLLHELKRLRSMNFVANHEGVGLSTIRRRYKDNQDQFNLKDYFYVRDERYGIYEAS